MSIDIGAPINFGARDYWESQAKTAGARALGTGARVPDVTEREDLRNRYARAHGAPAAAALSS
jgi:hypothetical protein